MTDIDLLEIIADWTGWPIVVAALLVFGSAVFFMMKTQINSLNSTITTKDAQLQDAENFKPDVLMQRLLNRHKALSEELESVLKDSEENQQEILQLQTKLNDSKISLHRLADQLDRALLLFKLGEIYPRDGIISPIVFQHFNLEIERHGKITLWFKPHSKKETLLNEEASSLYLSAEQVMFRIYLGIVNGDNNWLGFFINPFEGQGVYGNDYYETVLSFFPKYHDYGSGLPPTTPLPKGSNFIVIPSSTENLVLEIPIRPGDTPRIPYSID